MKSSRFSARAPRGSFGPPRPFGLRGAFGARGTFRHRGYTLLELMLATGLLAFLGSGMAVLLSQSVNLWRGAERRGRAYEAARGLLERIATDLRAAAPPVSSSEASPWRRFVADRGPDGQLRLRFTRSTPVETADPVLREGGRHLLTLTPRVADGIDDGREAREGLLAAAAGLEEVFYTQDASPAERRVWRGWRAPAGGPGSLFTDANVAPETKDPERARRGEVGASPPPERPYLESFARPVADGVLYLGFRFWGPGTTSWSAGQGGGSLLGASPRGGGQPFDLWDSASGTASRFASEVAGLSRAGGVVTQAVPLGAFPSLVEVVVVLGEPPQDLGPRLAADISPGEMALAVSRLVDLPEAPEDRWVRIESEWLRIEAADGTTLRVAPQGRGGRDTQAARHERGSPVELGMTFRRVIELPAARVLEAGGGRGPTGAGGATGAAGAGGRSRAPAPGAPRRRP